MDGGGEGGHVVGVSSPAPPKKFNLRVKVRTG